MSKIDYKLLKRSLSYVFKFKKLLAIGFILTAIASALSLSLPWIQKVLIDSISPGSSVRTLQTVVAVLVVIAVLRVIAGILKARVFARTQEKAKKDLRNEFVDHLLKLKLESSRNQNAGSVISVAMQDIEKIGSLYGSITSNLVTDVFKFIVLICIMIVLSWKLSIIVLPILVLLTLFMKDATTPIQKASKQVQESKAIVTESLSDFWNSIAETKVLNAQGYIRIIIDKVLEDLKRINVRFATILAMLQSVEVFIWIIAAVMLYIGGKDVIDGSMTIGSLIAFWGYMGMILGPMNNFVTSIGTARSCLGASERVFSVLDTGEKEYSESGVDFPHKFKQIHVDAVTFHFKDNEPVINNLNLDINRGDIVAIIGGSGSGKTSFSLLLTHLFSTRRGRICFDDINLTDINITSLRHNVGIVFQEPHIYNGTIEDNIRIAKTDAVNDEIIGAARLAMIHDFIISLPKGYQTKVGDGYRDLSGGQKQRIAIARLFLRSPSVLILDEATSALDKELEEDVLSNILSKFADATVIIISHRLPPDLNIDKVITF